MKKLIFLLLLFPAGLFSQNWQLINPGNVYFYKTNGSDLINNTVPCENPLGILEFPHLYGNGEHAVLAGVEGDTVAGMSLYKFHDYFKKISGDTLKYGISGIIKRNKQTGYRYEDTLVFTDSANHITNQYLKHTN